MIHANHERSVKLAACALFYARLALLFALFITRALNASARFEALQLVVMVVLVMTWVTMLLEVIMAVAMPAI